MELLKKLVPNALERFDHQIITNSFKCRSVGILCVIFNIQYD